MTQANVSQLTPKDKLAIAKNSAGLMSRVARKCNVDASLVGRVLRGTNTSKRITAALDVELGKELRRMAKLHERLQSSEKKTAPEAQVA